MTKLIRSIAGLAFVVASLLAFSTTAGAQTGPDYTGVVPTTQTQDASAANAVPSAAGELPYTGNDSLPLFQVGVALIVVGALAVFAVRRRNAHSPD